MENLEVYIFDQDGTLYPRESKLGETLTEKTRDWLLANLRFPVSFDEIRSRFPNFTDALRHNGLTLDQWHKTVCDPISAQMNILIERDPRLIEFLTSLSGNRYLVTLSSEQFTRELLSVLGLEKHFKGVFNSSLSDKGLTYEEIQHVEGVDPCKVGVFGDNDEIDLKPARDRGMKTFLVNPSRSITKQF